MASLLPPAEGARSSVLQDSASRVLSRNALSPTSTPMLLKEQLCLCTNSSCSLVHPMQTLTTSLTCFAKSLELPVRKSENAVCQTQDTRLVPRDSMAEWRPGMWLDCTGPSDVTGCHAKPFQLPTLGKSSSSPRHLGFDRPIPPPPPHNTGHWTPHSSAEAFPSEFTAPLPGPGFWDQLCSRTRIFLISVTKCNWLLWL